MEKKTWVMPEVQAVEFASEAYCSTCETTETGLRKLLFACNAGINAIFDANGNEICEGHGHSPKYEEQGYGWAGALWQDTNGVPGLQTKPSDDGTTTHDTWSGFAGCNIQHEIWVDSSFSVDNYFKQGWYFASLNGGDATWWDGNFNTEHVHDVWIWKGESGKEWHATDKLITSGIQYAKS